MNTRIKYGVLLLALVFSTSLFAQQQANSDVSFSMPEVALIDIEPGVNNTIYFEVDASPESGTEPVISENVNKTLWINYTSSQIGSQGSRSISTVISSGSVPAGINIFIRAAKYTGIGEGEKLGRRLGRKKLDNNPRTIIKNIKNCYTGDGVGNGHLLTFTMEIDDLTKVTSINDANFVVTYTLTDN